MQTFSSKQQNRDGGAAEVHKIADEEAEQGFRGVEVDKTPNEAYTVAGVLAGKETPESKRVDESEAAGK